MVRSTSPVLPRDPHAILTRYLRRRFSVSAYGQHRDREYHHYTTHQLDSAERVQEHYEHLVARPWVTRIALTQHDTVCTTRNTAFDDLPGEGEPTPLPPLPTGAFRVQRYYYIAEYGPNVLSTGDGVREQLDWMRRNRGRHPYNLDDIPDPDGVQLLQTTQVSYQRPVALDDLEDMPERRSIAYDANREHALAS